MTEKKASEQGSPGATGPGPEPIRRWTVPELMGSNSAAYVCHGDVIYTLRLTRNGKLILTR